MSCLCLSIDDFHADQPFAWAAYNVAEFRRDCPEHGTNVGGPSAASDAAGNKAGDQEEGFAVEGLNDNETTSGHPGLASKATGA